jgi:NHLM bacteriocin system secretion protein
MKPTKSFTLKKACIFIPISLFGLILLLAGISALSNIGLPQHSTTLDHLSTVEKAQLAEVLHLRTSLGDSVWPGWSQADIPLMVYNEQYAFLVAYPEPPDGWMKVPSMEQRGGPWEVVPNDTFEEQPYFRTQITDSKKTPEGFTVRVGNRWVATFQTREYSQVAFYRDFRQELPPVISNLIPLRLVWGLLMGKTDAYIAALEHESFHAYEGMQVVDRLAASESMYSVEENYPFDAMEEPWKQEMQLLIQAVHASTDEEAANFAQQFLQLRTTRREGLTPAQVELEELREWEEGLAKYAELELTQLAEIHAGYEPTDLILQDKNFKYYHGRQQFLEEQLKELEIEHDSNKDKITETENEIRKLREELEYNSFVVSPYSGRVLEVKMNKGDILEPGIPVISLELIGDAIKELEAIIYIPAEQGKMVYTGMEVHISPTTVKKEEYGFLLGRVTSVSEYPATRQRMLSLVGNEEIVSQLMGRSTPIEVHVDLVPDSNTESGYKWSSPKGPPTKINSGTLCTSSVTVQNVPPIKKVLPIR